MYLNDLINYLQLNSILLKSIVEMSYILKAIVNFLDISIDSVSSKPNDPHYFSTADYLHSERRVTSGSHQGLPASPTLGKRRDTQVAAPLVLVESR